MRNKTVCAKVLPMKLDTIQISPVNMEERKELGIRSGDTVRVWVKIQEKDKTRLQAFEGLVLARKHGNEAGATFTVRKVASGVGVERIFPLFSPAIDKIEIVKRSRVRRSKLYFIREKVAREIRRQMRKMKMMDLSTGSDIADEAERVKKEEEEKLRQEEESKKAEEIVDEIATQEPEEVVIQEQKPKHKEEKEEAEEEIEEKVEEIEKEILAEEEAEEDILEK